MSGKLMSKVFELKNLTQSQKFVLIAMADFADDYGNNVFPSLARLAWKTELCERQVRRIIQKLVAKGILVEVSLNKGGRKLTPSGHVVGKTNIYKIELYSDMLKEPFAISKEADNADILTSTLSDSENSTTRTFQQDNPDNSTLNADISTQPTRTNQAHNADAQMSDNPLLETLLEAPSKTPLELVDISRTRAKTFSTNSKFSEFYSLLKDKPEINQKTSEKDWQDLFSRFRNDGMFLGEMNNFIFEVITSFEIIGINVEGKLNAAIFHKAYESTCSEHEMRKLAALIN